MLLEQENLAYSSLRICISSNEHSSFVCIMFLGFLLKFVFPTPSILCGGDESDTDESVEAHLKKTISYVVL